MACFIKPVQNTFDAIDTALKSKKCSTREIGSRLSSLKAIPCELLAAFGELIKLPYILLLQPLKITVSICRLWIKSNCLKKIDKNLLSLKIIFITALRVILFSCMVFSDLFFGFLLCPRFNYQLHTTFNLISKKEPPPRLPDRFNPQEIVSDAELDDQGNF